MVPSLVDCLRYSYLEEGTTRDALKRLAHRKGIHQEAKMLQEYFAALPNGSKVDYREVHAALTDHEWTMPLPQLSTHLKYLHQHYELRRASGSSRHCGNYVVDRKAIPKLEKLLQGKDPSIPLVMARVPGGFVFLGASLDIETYEVLNALLHLDTEDPLWVVCQLRASDFATQVKTSGLTLTHVVEKMSAAVAANLSSIQLGI